MCREWISWEISRSTRAISGDILPRTQASICRAYSPLNCQVANMSSHGHLCKHSKLRFICWSPVSWEVFPLGLERKKTQSALGYLVTARLCYTSGWVLEGSNWYFPKTGATVDALTLKRLSGKKSPHHIPQRFDRRFQNYVSFFFPV